jgi:hypothetical protein
MPLNFDEGIIDCSFPFLLTLSILQPVKLTLTSLGLYSAMNSPVELPSLI